MVLYPNVTFGDYLRTQLEVLQVRPAELARRTGMTKQNLSRIINNIPHWQTGALPRVTVETVDKIAQALDIDQNEARLAAGYAADSPEASFNIADKARIALLDKDLTPEEAQEIAEEMALAYRIIMERRRERQTRDTNTHQ